MTLDGGNPEILSHRSFGSEKSRQALFCRSFCKGLRTEPVPQLSHHVEPVPPSADLGSGGTGRQRNRFQRSTIKISGMEAMDWVERVIFLEIPKFLLNTDLLRILIA